MESFVNEYGHKTNCILQGFDRIIIKGHIKDFYHANNFYYFLEKESTRLKDFKEYVIKVTGQIKQHIKELIELNGCCYEYLNDPRRSKEEIAKQIMAEHPDMEGLICVISDVEPCYSLTIKYNEKTRKLEKQNEFRKCQHYYFYFNDRELGFMHVRLQTWFPFGIQIYINGKEYLKKRLTKQGISFTSHDNSITSVSDPEKAQAISDTFIENKWNKTFDHFANMVNGYLPRIREIFNHHGYYWYIEQCEYASDVLFKDRNTLESVYPHFLEYASLCQMGENIFTFFGRKVHHLCKGEAVSDRKHFWGQGFRVKFTLDKNFLKLYDKSNVLRIETTINNAGAFKILNPNQQGKKKWVPMGKNISNLYRYAEIMKKCNERYLNSLAAVNKNGDLGKSIENLCHPVKTKLSKNSLNERYYSAFNLLKDLSCNLFNSVMNGAYMIRGFTTKQLTQSLIALYSFPKESVHNMKKLIAKVGRLIAKLRAHGLVIKLPKTFRYRVTKKGQEILTRILMFKKIDLKFC
jgi:hypothetical protein